MYAVDEHDEVVELHDVPPPDVGAPLPVVAGSDNQLMLAYIVFEPDPEWDGTWARSVTMETDDEPIAIINFRLAHAHMFGAPNDEAFSGHPLYERGLHQYAVFEVKHSSWIRRLERMNAVHPHHNPERFASLRHFVFAFHDSTFECVAEDLEVFMCRGSIRSAVQKMTEMLDA